jgi:hypothetical protein
MIGGMACDTDYGRWRDPVFRPSSASDPVELRDRLRQSQMAACADAHDQGYPRRVHY